MTQPPFFGNNFRDQIDSVARNLTGGAFRLKRDDPEAPNKFMDFVARSEQEFMQPQQVNPGLAAGQRRAEIQAAAQERVAAQPSMGLLETFLTQTPLGRRTLDAADLAQRQADEAAGAFRLGGRVLPDQILGREPVLITQRETEFDRAFQDARSRGLRLADAYREAAPFAHQIPVGDEQTGRHGFLDFVAGLGEVVRGDLGQTGGERRPLFEVSTADLGAGVADPLNVLPGVGEAGQIFRGTRAAVSGARGGIGATLRGGEQAAAAIGRTGVGNVLDPVPQLRTQGRFIPEDIDKGPLRVFISAEDAAKGGDRGRTIRGRMTTKQDLPETVFHVTSDSQGVRNSNVLRASAGEGGGLGGATANETVSFTTSATDADDIATELIRIGEVARAGSDDEAIVIMNRIISEDAQRAGVTAEAIGEADEIVSSIYGADWRTRANLSRVEVYRAYLTRRETVRRGQFTGGEPIPGLRQDPIILMDDAQARLITPESVEVIAVPSRTLPDAPLITDRVSGDFLNEIQVHGDVDISGVRQPTTPATQVDAAARGVAPRTLETAQTGQPFQARLFRGQGGATRGGIEEGGANIVGEGRYSTPDREYAKIFGSDVQEVDVTLQNPLVIRTDAEYAKVIKDAGLEPTSMGQARLSDPDNLSVAANNARIAQFRNYVDSQGYDGIVFDPPVTSDAGRRMLEDIGESQVVQFSRQADVAARGVVPRGSVKLTKAQKEELVRDMQPSAEALVYASDDLGFGAEELAFLRKFTNEDGMVVLPDTISGKDLIILRDYADNAASKLDDLGDLSRYIPEDRSEIARLRATQRSLNNLIGKIDDLPTTPATQADVAARGVGDVPAKSAFDAAKGEKVTVYDSAGNPREATVAYRSNTDKRFVAVTVMEDGRKSGRIQLEDAVTGVQGDASSAGLLYAENPTTPAYKALIDENNQAEKIKEKIRQKEDYSDAESDFINKWWKRQSAAQEAGSAADVAPITPATQADVAARGVGAEPPTTPVTRQQGAVSQAAEEVAQPQLIDDVTLPPEPPPARPIATGGKPRDWSKVPDTGRQGVLLEVPPTEIGENLLDLRPIQVRELGVVDRSLNAARATLGKLTNKEVVLKNKIVNAAFAEVRRVQSRITSQANLKSSVISRHAKAFVTDKQGRIPSLAGIDPSLPGAPTIQDVAARRPRYLAALTEEQKNALEQIRLELDDYRIAREEVGVEISGRSDLVAGANPTESGFYIPRGGNPLSPDLPRSTRQTGGRIGAEQRAVYDSMAQAIDDGATYFPLGDTIKNFGQTLGERLANQHAANFLRRLEVETGIPLGRAGGKPLPGEISIPAGSAVPTLRELRGTTFPPEITNAVNEILATQGDLVGRGSEVLKVLNAYNNFYRGARSTADNSAIMIQGLLGSASDPQASARALLLNMEIWRTGEARTIFGRYLMEIDKYGKTVFGIDDFSQIAAQKGLILNGGETELTQSLVTRLPGARRASNAFGFYGDALRIGWLGDEAFIEMRRTGKTWQQIVDDGTLENLAKAINAATGMSEGNRFTDLSSLVLFAPRFLQSRLVTVARGIRGLDVDAPLDILPSSLRRRVPLSPAPLNRAARLQDRIARKALIRLIGWGAAITVGANAALGQETDFRLFVNGRPNPNFMRIRFGERDYSVYGTWDSIGKLIIGTAQGLSKGQLDTILESGRGLGSGLVVQLWDFFSRRDFEGRNTRDTPMQFAAHVTRSHLPFQAEELPAATGKIIQGTREGDIGQIATGAAQIALEGHGAKSSPLSRGDQLDILAKSQLGKPYSEINLLERFQLESDPEIAPLLAEIDADLAARGRVSAEYRVERANAEKALKDFQKQDLDKFILQWRFLPWRMPRSGNRIYAKIGDREITVRGLLNDLAGYISETKGNIYANLNGWRKAKGLDNYVGEEPTNEFDKMLNDWYDLLDEHTMSTKIGESEYEGRLIFDTWIPASEKFISELTPELQQQLAEWRDRKEDIPGLQALLDLRGPIGKKADGSLEWHSDSALLQEIVKILEESGITTDYVNNLKRAQ